MISQFVRGNNNILLSHFEDEQLPEFKNLDIFALIGFLFHHIQQLGGTLTLNGTEVFALSMSQTCGSSLNGNDFVGIHITPPHVIAVKLKTLLVPTPTLLGPPICKEEVKAKALIRALKDMCIEFRGHDLPYGSKAYAEANRLINLYDD
jgi:hypothetical protein